MILPTPEYAPWVATSGEAFRATMIDYIRTHFADLLGPDVRLLDQPDGLEKILQKYGLQQTSARRSA